MLSLGAVIPHWCFAGNANGVGENVLQVRDGAVRGHESREESVRLIWHDIVDRRARPIEGGLNNGVILQYS